MRPSRASLAAAVAIAATSPPAAAQSRTPLEREPLGGLGAVAIDESSGVAVSRQYRGVLWTHNDSGDGPVLYAVRMSGELLARFAVAGARSVDWEDITLGPCPFRDAQDRPCLFIADTGDNGAERSAVYIYIVPEPDPVGVGTAERITVPARALRIRYAGGPRDAEALAAHPDGHLTLITKGRHGPIVRYEIPRAALLADTLVIHPADTLPIVPQPIEGRWVTAAAVSPSGSQAVLGTHTELYFFRASGAGWTLEGDPCWLGFPLRQYEGVDFLDDGSVVVTSERALGNDGVIHRIRC